jgi:hypothetical protein
MTTSLSTYEKALELDSFDSIAIARNRFPGSVAGKMGDASDTQERPMSGGPIARPIESGRSPKITASPSRPGQSGVGIDYRLPTTISFFAISEAGRSIVQPSARMQLASIVESTALHSGIAETPKSWERFSRQDKRKKSLSNSTYRSRRESSQSSLSPLSRDEICVLPALIKSDLQLGSFLPSELTAERVERRALSLPSEGKFNNEGWV